MLNDSPCPPGHNTPLPLERSATASFKRLLGGTREGSGPLCTVRNELSLAPRSDRRHANRKIVSHRTFLPVPVERHADRRSEEHTSELQSQSNLVCRLLL